MKHPPVKLISVEQDTGVTNFPGEHWRHFPQAATQEATITDKKKSAKEVCLSYISGTSVFRVDYIKIYTNICTSINLITFNIGITIIYLKFMNKMINVFSSGMHIG